MVSLAALGGGEPMEAEGKGGGVGPHENVYVLSLMRFFFSFGGLRSRRAGRRSLAAGRRTALPRNAGRGPVHLDIRHYPVGSVCSRVSKLITHSGRENPDRGSRNPMKRVCASYFKREEATKQWRDHIRHLNKRRRVSLIPNPGSGPSSEQTDSTSPLAVMR